MLISSILPLFAPDALSIVRSISQSRFIGRGKQNSKSWIKGNPFQLSKIHSLKIFQMLCRPVTIFVLNSWQIMFWIFKKLSHHIYHLLEYYKLDYLETWFPPLVSRKQKFSNLLSIEFCVIHSFLPKDKKDKTKSFAAHCKIRSHGLGKDVLLFTFYTCATLQQGWELESRLPIAIKIVNFRLSAISE